MSTCTCESKNSLPAVVTGDVVKERLGLVIVAVGSQGVFFISIALTVLGLHARVTLIFPVQSLLWLLGLLICAWEQTQIQTH